MGVCCHDGESDGKNTEHEMDTLGPFKGVYTDIPTMMESQMGKKSNMKWTLGL